MGFKVSERFFEKMYLMNPSKVHVIKQNKSVLEDETKCLARSLGRDRKCFNHILISILSQLRETSTISSSLVAKNDKQRDAFPFNLLSLICYRANPYKEWQK